MSLWENRDMMLKSESKQEIIRRLKGDLLRWEGCNASQEGTKPLGLGPLERAFPSGVFPLGGLHEFISTDPEQKAASNGFIAGLLGCLMSKGSACLWISASRTVFPPALKNFGVDPDRILFADLRYEKDVLWALEESLKCPGLTAVVAELRDLDFIQSRRLQLAVEKTRVTGFLLRNNPRYLTTTACAARWQVRPVPSDAEDGMPGVGFPRWHVALLKVRNGLPGNWFVEWSAGRFHPVPSTAPAATPPAAASSAADSPASARNTG